MATEQIILTQEWQQLTDGSETKLIQSRDGMFELSEGANQPSQHFSGHLFSMVTVTPPSVVWVKCVVSPGEVVCVTNFSS